MQTIYKYLLSDSTSALQTSECAPHLLPLQSYMKNLFKLLATIFLCSTTLWLATTQAEGLPVVRDLRIEAKISQKIQAPILVLFMSKHCTYCETVLQDFLIPMHKDPAYKSKVILRQVETGSKDMLADFDGTRVSQSEFSRKNKAWAVPTLVLFDSQGHELSRIVGLLTVDFYLASLDNAINESQAKIKAGNN